MDSLPFFLITARGIHKLLPEVRLFSECPQMLCVVEGTEPPRGEVLLSLGWLFINTARQELAFLKLLV